MGNEYHAICCLLSEIMYRIELIEGKDAPKDRPALEFSSCTKTATLLLRLCKSIFSTCKVVILDSGFCALKALIALL